MPTQKLRILVGGMVGQFPLGGVAWDYFHYVIGLAALGHDVYYYEDTWVWPHDPVKGHPTDSPDYTVGFISDFFRDYAPQLSDRWCYVLLHDKCYGMSREKLNEVAASADVFINVSGACFFPDNLSAKCVKVFIDTDPGYNQIVLHERPAWSQNVDRWAQLVLAHDVHLTYAENIYADDCLIPRCDIDWRPTRCVVTMPSWQSVCDSAPAKGSAYTTVMSWKWFNGAVAHRGREYFAKAEEYAKFHDLPKRVSVPLLLAVGGHIHPADEIIADGWKLVDANHVSLTSTSYMKFIGDSAGEWSVAKNIYVATNSGWFSCRTACYLAAGRPAVVQETGWSRYVPSGAGVIAFTTMDETIAALAEVDAHPEWHRDAAYDIAREYLAADRVLPPMIDAIFASKGSARTLDMLPPGKTDNS